MRKKLVSFICAAVMMAAIPMQANAAELTNVNGVSIETADYSDSYFLEDGSAEGIAKGIEQRGSIIDTATVQISNLGKGDIGIIIETLAHVECDKIKNILENIAFYKNLWNDPDTQGLLKHAGKRFGHIWKRLRPRKLTVNATVGTGSPDTTGYLYGIYGMVLPKLGKGICITPDFEQAILEGDFKASGHFTAACVLFHSVRLLLDRRLRELLHKIRQYQKTQKK